MWSLMQREGARDLQKLTPGPWKVRKTATAKKGPHRFQPVCLVLECHWSRSLDPDTDTSSTRIQPSKFKDLWALLVDSWTRQPPSSSRKSPRNYRKGKKVSKAREGWDKGRVNRKNCLSMHFPLETKYYLPPGADQKSDQEWGFQSWGSLKPQLV